MFTPEEKQPLAYLYSQVASHGGAQKRIFHTEDDTLAIQFTSVNTESLNSSVYAAKALDKAGLLVNPTDTSGKLKAPPSEDKPVALADNLALTVANKKLFLTFTPPEEMPVEELQRRLEEAEMQAKAAVHSRARLSR